MLQTIVSIPEVLVKKRAEQTRTTAISYEEALTQHWTFLDDIDLARVGQVDESAVTRFPLIGEREAWP